MKKFIIIGISLTILAGVCFAALPWQKYSYWQNWGGLNDNLSSTEIADGEASDLQNVVFDTGGAIKKRFGYLTITADTFYTISGDTGVVVTGLYFFKENDNDRHLIAIGNVGGKAVASKKTYSVGGGLPAGPWTIIDGTGNLPQTGYGDDKLVSFTTAENLAVFAMSSTNGQKAFKWGGADSNLSLVTTDADCPESSIVVYHKNHLFTNDTDNPSRIFFSNLDDITTCTATDFIDIQTNDGTKVRGMVSALDSLYIFKDKSIWRLSGTERDTWFLQKMIDGVGTLSHQSIAILGNKIFFTTNQNDIAVYNGAFELVFLSQKIRTSIGGLNFSRATNNLGIGFSAYKNNDYDYYVATSTAGVSTNNRVLLFDTAFNAWTKFVGLNANAWTVCDNSSTVGKNSLCFGDYSGYVHQYPSSSYYDGDVSDTAINAYYVTKWFRYPDISLGDKYWRVLKTYTQSETSSNTYLTAEARADYQAAGKALSLGLSTEGSLWDDFVWDADVWSGTGLITHRSEIEKGKNMFQLKLSNSLVNQGFTVFGWEMFIEPTDRD